MESEIKVYLKALESGPSAVADLSKAAGLSRQATYVAIKELTARGVFSSVLKGKKMLYAAESPDKLLAYIKSRREKMADMIKEVEESIPELKQMVSKDFPTVKMFEGREGIGAILEELKLLPNKTEIFEISDLNSMYKLLKPEDLLALRNKLKVKKATIKGIYLGGASRKVADVQRAFLPEKTGGFGCNVGVYGNKIIMVTFSGKIISIIIDNENLAKTLRLILGLAFQQAKLKKGA